MSRMTNPNIDMRAIKTAHQLLRQIKDDILDNPEWGWGLSLEDFAVAMSCLPPQVRGYRIEKRLQDLLGLFSSGDEPQEIKGSLISAYNTQLSLVQISKDVSYVIYCFDLRDIDNVKSQFFCLTKSQMENEISTWGTNANVNNLNRNHELVLRLEIGDDNYKRWVKDYGISTDVKKKLTSYFALKTFW